MLWDNLQLTIFQNFLNKCAKDSNATPWSPPANELKWPDTVTSSDQSQLMEKIQRSTMDRIYGATSDSIYMEIENGWTIMN